MMSNIIPSHVLIFPLPIQGHINSMLNLAELLSLSGIHITFIITDHIYPSLTKHSTVLSRFSKYPGFRFQTIWDGLPEHASRSGDGLFDMYSSMKLETKPILKDMLVSNQLSSGHRGPVTSIIADGILGLVLEVGEDVGIPVFYFRTISACCLWAYLCIPALVDAGELPFKDDDLDVLIKNIPSMKGFVRRRDLPSFCRVTDLSSDVAFQMVSTETIKTTRAHGVIINTFEDLEGPIVKEISVLCPKLYAIGPISMHLDAKLGDQSLGFSNSLLEEDKSCLKWLDSQSPRSVIYVSFGSIATMTWDQLSEFWYGLINSGQKFLWVQRRDTLPHGVGESHIPKELIEGTAERGYIVEWAPQQEVLGHMAVGGFLTHSGWNSTLESIAAALPMICWPFFADQQINSRFVQEIWKLGLDMKDVWDRATVEKMVRDLMVVRKEEFARSAHLMAQKARAAVGEGGPSFRAFNSLIDEIRLISNLGARHNFVSND